MGIQKLLESPGQQEDFCHVCRGRGPGCVMSSNEFNWYLLQDDLLDKR